MKSIRKKKPEKRINEIKMPEGPSIVILKEAILHFKGREIIQVTGNSKVGIQAFNNTVISDIRSFGKQLLISLSSGLTIRIHFMLFGSYSIDEKKDRPERLGIKTEVGEINFYACSVNTTNQKSSLRKNKKKGFLLSKLSGALYLKKGFT